MQHIDHECDCIKKTSTENAPYRYVGSGLPNVYLVGVAYESCSACGMQSAEIPALNELLAAIARVLFNKEAPITGEELRFLRKRMRIPANQFAAVLGFTDSHYSKFENGKAPIPGSIDKLVRLIYASLVRDPQLTSSQAESVSLAMPWSAAFDNKECIIASRDENEHWRVVKKAA